MRLFRGLVKLALDTFRQLCYNCRGDAVVAQLAEQLIRNEQVAGSTPVNGSRDSLINKKDVNCTEATGVFFRVNNQSIVARRRIAFLKDSKR